MKNYIIAVDGPAGVGKSSLSKALAHDLGVVYVDTGAMYRAVGLYCKENNIELDDLKNHLNEIEIELSCGERGQQIFLNGRDVSLDIRISDISKYASNVAKIPEVRACLCEMQRAMGKDKSVVMDGRDIGTKIFPDADVKFFVTASPEVRAERRVKELSELNQKVSFEEILSDIKFRDENDSKRAADPLRPADDAVMIDNSVNTFEETKARMLGIIKNKIKECD